MKEASAPNSTPGLVGYLALVSTILAILVTVYSLLFPIWVYAVLFAIPRQGSTVFWQGLQAPIERYPKSSLVCILLMLVAIGAALFWKRFSRRFSMYASRILFIAMALIILLLLRVLGFDKDLYSRAIEARQFAEFKKATAGLFQRVGTPSAPDVAYFLYLDQKQIESLYAQIEPEWLNKQRTVTESSGSSLKAGISAPPASVEVGSSGQKKNQVVQEPPTPTLERKTISFMRYASENGKASQFTVSTAWVALRSAAIALRSQFSSLDQVAEVPLPLNRNDIEKTNRDELFGNSPEKKQQAKHNFESELHAMLTLLPPFVFVKGEFRVDIAPSPLLVHDYIDGPEWLSFRPTQFLVRFPPSIPLPLEFKDKKTIQATVFGKVVHGLDSEGVVEVQAIAVY